MTIPGVGQVVSAVFVAIIDGPGCFPGKRQLWSYAGLGVRRSWSSDPKRTRKGGSNSGNRLLKYAALTAARNALRTDKCFARHHDRLVSTGTAPSMARRTIARNILAAALSMWRNRTEYCDTYGSSSGSRETRLVPGPGKISDRG